jgi:SAM-dependent methyltransferase
MPKLINAHEENIRKFPELDPKALVRVDHLANGFLMNGITSSSFDFVIANHVLEHASNPVGALVQWFRVLKPGGILFCALPRIDITFDKGRKLTSTRHMLDDYRLSEEPNPTAMRERNLDHYHEWLSIAIPAHTGLPPPLPNDMAVQVSAYADREEEIHFHTFTMASALDLVAETRKEILPQMSVVEALDARAEILLILRKSNLTS